MICLPGVARFKEREKRVRAIGPTELIIIILFMFRKRLRTFIFQVGKDGLRSELHAGGEVASPPDAAPPKPGGVNISGNVQVGQGHRIDVGRGDTTVRENIQTGREQEIVVRPEGGVSGPPRPRPTSRRRSAPGARNCANSSSPTLTMANCATFALILALITRACPATVSETKRAKSSATSPIATGWMSWKPTAANSAPTPPGNWYDDVDRRLRRRAPTIPRFAGRTLPAANPAFSRPQRLRQNDPDQRLPAQPDQPGRGYAACAHSTTGDRRQCR